MSMYITLPCTASKSAFPDNTRGKYITLLAQELVLAGDYEAGICEILLPVPRFTMQEDSEVAYGKIDDTRREYFTIKKQDILSLDRTPVPTDLTGNPYFDFVIEDGKVWLIISPDCYVEFLSGPLGPALGFGDDKRKKFGKSSYSLKQRLSDVVYIYCDLCEYSIVGDALVPCLRVVPLKSREETIVRFDNIHYAPVDGNRFSTIEIAISDDLGRVVDFSEGITIVKLHLRPRK
jgi:hypothetical protein